MQITSILLETRSGWRTWLHENHALSKEIWLIRSGVGSFSYLDSVEEAICFGWIDGIAKKTSTGDLAQRFSPRRRGGNWTELNKARAQRLIRLGLMTDAGKANLPPLELRQDVSADISEALSAVNPAMCNFNNFPLLYRAARIGYIEEMRRNPDEFEKRLRNFVRKTALNKMFGNWNDDGRLSDHELTFALRAK